MEAGGQLVEALNEVESAPLDALGHFSKRRALLDRCLDVVDAFGAAIVLRVGNGVAAGLCKLGAPATTFLTDNCFDARFLPFETQMKLAAWKLK